MKRLLTLSDSDLDQTPEEFLSGAKKLLGIDCDYKGYQCRTEITLQYPRTVPFKKLSKEQQKDLYASVFERILMHHPSAVKRFKYTFEHCKDGNVHLHAYIDFEFKHQISPAGLCCEITDLWLRSLPKRFNHPLVGNALDNYNSDFRRICIPQICIQFRYMDETERLKAWEVYIEKCVQKSE